MKKWIFIKMNKKGWVGRGKEGWRTERRKKERRKNEI